MLPANTQLTLTTLPLVSDWTTRSSLAEPVPVFFSVKRKVTGFWKLAVFTPPTAEPVNEYDKAVGAAATCSADDVTTDAPDTDHSNHNPAHVPPPAPLLEPIRRRPGAKTSSRETRRTGAACACQRPGGSRGAAQQPWAGHQRDRVEHRHDDQQGPVTGEQRGVLEDAAEHCAEQVGAERGDGFRDCLETLREDEVGDEDRCEGQQHGADESGQEVQCQQALER